MSTRSQILVAVGGAILVAVAALAIWKLTTRPSTPPPKAHKAQIYDVEPDPRMTIGVPLRPMDRDIFDAIAKDDFRREQLPDLFPDRPYRVHLTKDFIENRIIVLLIDLDRDGRYDERWQLQPEGVTRYITPATNGPESLPFRLRKGRWVPF
jgi:hypothetical protein